MAIERTVVARCDEGCDEGCCGCPNEVKLNPDSSQVFRDLREDFGWGLVTTDATILTYCPIHKDNHKES